MAAAAESPASNSPVLSMQLLAPVTSSTRDADVASAAEGGLHKPDSDNNNNRVCRMKPVRAVNAVFDRDLSLTLTSARDADLTAPA